MKYIDFLLTEMLLLRDGCYVAGVTSIVLLINYPVHHTICQLLIAIHSPDVPTYLTAAAAQ